MEIYVASLSDYNAGVLHGQWFDLNNYNDADELEEDIQAMLASSPTAKSEGQPAEEWAIHDYNDAVSGLGEYESLEHLVELNNALQEHGDAYRAYLEHVDGDGSVRDFENKFQGGPYDSEEDFAVELLEETGDLNEIPENLRYYFDYEKFARDLFMTDYTFADGYVFYNY